MPTRTRDQSVIVGAGVVIFEFQNGVTVNIRQGDAGCADVIAFRADDEVLNPNTGRFDTHMGDQSAVMTLTAIELVRVLAVMQNNKPGA
jgi:hypothetical protein